MTSSMGVAKDAAFEMSTGAVELAADMASFYNLNHEDALNKIKSGLVGEAEPLKQLGILVDEATIKTAAYEAGIATWGAELTATEKVQARWLAIQNQTIKAQGDLARTIESPSNQIKLMRGQIVQASIDLSVALLPAFTLVVGALSEFSDELIAGTRVAAEWVTTWFDTGGLIAVTGYIDALTAGVFGTVAVLRDGIGFVVRWKDVIVALGTGVAVAALAWGGYTLAIGLSTAATVVWGAAVAVATGGITLVLPAVIALIAGLTAGWALWGDEITDFVAGIGNRFIGWAESFMDWARPAAAFLGVEFPESLDRFETSAAEVTVELGAMQDAWEASTAAQQAANQDQYTAELIRQAAAGATLTKEQQALVLAQRDGVVGIADLRAGWASLDTEGQAANMRGYAASLEDAESQGFKLTKQEYDLIDALDQEAISATDAAEAEDVSAEAREGAAKAAETEALALAAVSRELTGLPTLGAVEDARLLRTAWEDLDADAQAAATLRYGEALSDLRDADVELTAAEVDLVTAYDDHEAAIIAVTQADADLLAAQEAATAATEAETEAVADLTRELLGLPTPGAIADFERLEAVWASLTPEEQALATAAYADALRGAAEGGIALNNAQVALATSAGASWLDRYTDILSPDAIGQTLARAFEGAAGFMGALKSLASQVAGAFTSHMGSLLSTGLQTILPSVFGSVASSIAPAAAAAGTTAGTAVGTSAAASAGTSLFSGLGSVAAAIPGWGWAAAGVAAAVYFFKGWGGPSQAELEARAIFDGFHQGVVETLGGTQAFADEVQVAINQGWDTTLAETRAGFILFGTDAGLTYDQAFADYERYQQAVGAGNTALMEQIEADYARYREASEEANEAASRAWESASNAAVSAFRASEDAGVSAYDEIFEEAIASGLGQEEAIAQATAAQLVATAEVLAAKREEFVFDAAMNAAMALGAHATAEERAEAARGAATAARESWGAAMDAVVASDQAASDAMDTTWNPESGDVVTDVDGTADAIVLTMEQAERDLQIQFENMSAAAGTEAQSIESSFNAIEIEDQSFTIREHRRFSYSGFQEFGEGVEGRQHGGPVRAGHPYLVGEGGKAEIFVPQQAGNIVPSGSGGGGSRPSSVTIVIKNELDGDELTEQHIKLSPRILDRLGLTP